MTNIDQVLRHLASGRTITALEAIGLYGHYRLASTINQLRRKGYKINTTMKIDINGKQYAEYALRSAKKAAA